MNVSTWCIKNPIAAIMFFVLLCFAGTLSYQAMKVQNFPDLDVPNIIISASLPGAAPAQLETEVARKMESAIASLQGLKNIYTTVQDGVVTITAEFRLEKPSQEALDETRSAIQQVRADMPAELRDPVVSKVNVAGAPVLAYTIRSKALDDEALSWFVDDTLTRTLLGVRGVGSVNRVGGVTREVRVALNSAKMQALGVSASTVSKQLRQVQMDTAGGRVDIGSSEQPLRTLATVKSADELANLELSLGDNGGGGRKAKLSQLADIQDTTAEPRSSALLNGVPVVGFEISRAKGSSEVDVGKGVRAALAQLKVTYPDLELVEAFDFVTPVEEEYQASLTLLVEGALLAVLVVWLFLRDWRATFITAVALPLSVIPAFIGMNYLGFSINVVTLLALSLVIGILVDDAIVEVENIVRHLRMGKTPYQAAMEAADEIGLAVIATTFTLIAVFLPTAFMSGIAGKFFKQFGWTASLAVFASLVVARMLTPMMSAYLLKPIVDYVEKEGPVMRWYMRASRWALNHRWLTGLAAGGFFVGSLMLIPLLPTGFIPPDDNSQTQVYLELAPGSKLTDTLQAAESARLMLMKVEHVKSVYTAVGGGSAGSDPFAPSGGAEKRKASLTILLTPRGDRPRKQVIENKMRAALTELPGVRSKVGLGGSGESLLLSLTSENPASLSAAAAALEKDLRTIPGLGSVASTAALVQSELVVRPDFARMADQGVTSSAIGETLRIATVGDYNAALSKLNLPGRQVPIVVRLADDARTDLAQLERLMVPSNKPGVGSVMLGQVATLELASGPAVISRFNRLRDVKFEIELSGLPLGDVTALVNKLPAIVNLPADVKQVTTGDAEVMGELFASFGLAMLTGVLCIYIVLVLLFKDLLHPVTILAALPLSLGGAFVGLLLADKSFSMPSLIGLIMLMGVATKNSILLVEYAIVARRGTLRQAQDNRADSEHGPWLIEPMNRLDALLDACHKRARPIVMTTIAMGAGMMPIAFGWGAADSSFRSPMAVAVIGGLITSTVLSLLVVPAVFTFVDDGGLFIRKLFRRKSSAPIPAPADAPADGLKAAHRAL